MSLIVALGLFTHATWPACYILQPIIVSLWFLSLAEATFLSLVLHVWSEVAYLANLVGRCISCIFIIKCCLRFLPPSMTTDVTEIRSRVCLQSDCL